MRRKLTPHGPSSLTISLPATWIKHNNLKKGEELELIEEENNIVIKPTATAPDAKVIEISLVDIDKKISEDMILALHNQGYDEIKILINTPDKIKDIHAFLNHMQLGFEIIRQEPDSITIRNISNPEIEQFDNLFRRVFRITIEYANKIEGIINNRNEMTHSYILHEVSINRISNYCKRIIIKERRKNACFFYAIIEELNNITCNLTIMLNKIMNQEENIPKNTVIKYSEITTMLIHVYELYYKFSITEYAHIKTNLESAKKALVKLRSQSKSQKSSSIDFLDNIELIREGIQNLLELTLAIQY